LPHHFETVGQDLCRGRPALEARARCPRHIGEQVPSFVTVLLLLFVGSACQASVLPNRWVYVSRSLQRDGDIVDIKSITRTAAESGLNGMVLAAGLDRLDRQNQGYFARIERVRNICKQNNIEIIPIIFSVGYGGSVLGHDKNLAAGMFVEDALYVVENGTAQFVQDSPAVIANGGFEKYDGDHLTSYNFHARSTAAAGRRCASRTSADTSMVTRG